MNFDSKLTSFSSYQYNYKPIKKKLGTIMDEYVGIVRTKDGLNFAKNEVEKIESNLEKYPNNSKYYFEALNMVQTALLIINSAITRKESIGCHYRIN